MPSRYQHTRGLGSRKPGIWARPLEGHPLAPLCAFLFNELAGSNSARSWGRTGLQAPLTSNTTFGADVLNLWCHDGLNFTGSTNNLVIQVLSDSILHLNRNFTLVVRAMSRLAVLNAPYALVSWPQNGYYVRFAGDGTGNHFSLIQSRVGGFSVNTTANGLAVNRPYTLGATVSTGSTATVKTWVDGVPDGSATTSVTFSSSNNIRLGSDTTGSTNTATGSEFLDGRIAWIQWFDRELTAPEMMAVHHRPFAWLSAGAPRRNFTNGPGPVTSYPGSMLCHL